MVVWRPRNARKPMAGLCSRRCLAIFSVNQHSTRPISTRDQDRVLDSDLQDQEQEQEQDSYWMEPVRHMNLLIAGEAPRQQYVCQSLSAPLTLYVTLKLQSMVIGTLAVYGWTVTFGTATKNLGRPGRPRCTKCNSSPIINSWCTNFVLFDVAHCLCTLKG